MIVLAPLALANSYSLTYQATTSRTWSPVPKGTGTISVTTSSIPPVMKASAAASTVNSWANYSKLDDYSYVTGQQQFLTSGNYGLSVLYSFAVGAGDFAASARCGASGNYANATAEMFVQVQIFNSFNHTLITQGSAPLALKWIVGTGQIQGTNQQNVTCHANNAESINNSADSVTNANITGLFGHQWINSGIGIYVEVLWIFYVTVYAAPAPPLNNNYASAWVNGTSSDTFSVTSVNWW